MLKLLLLTLGTWSVLSWFLVGTLGFLLRLRQSARTPAVLRRAGANWCTDGYVVRTRSVDLDLRPTPRIKLSPKKEP